MVVLTVLILMFLQPFIGLFQLFHLSGQIWLKTASVTLALALVVAS